MNKTAPLILLSSSIFLASCSTNSNRSFSQVATNAVLGGIVLAGLNEAKNGDKDSDGGSDGSKGLGAILIGAVAYSIYKGMGKDSSTEEGRETITAGELSKRIVAKNEKEISWREKTKNGNLLLDFNGFSPVFMPVATTGRITNIYKEKSERLLMFNLLYLDYYQKKGEVLPSIIGGYDFQRKMINRELRGRNSKFDINLYLSVVTVAAVGVMGYIGIKSLGDNKVHTTKENEDNYKEFKTRGNRHYITCNNGGKQIHYIKDGYWNIGFWSNKTTMGWSNKTSSKASEYTPREFANKVCK